MSHSDSVLGGIVMGNMEELCIRPSFKVGDIVWGNGLLIGYDDRKLRVVEISISRDKRFLYKMLDPLFPYDPYDFDDSQVGTAIFKTEKELDEYHKY